MVVAGLIGFFLDAAKLKKSSLALGNLESPVKLLTIAAIFLTALGLIFGMIFGAAPFSRAKGRLTRAQPNSKPEVFARFARVPPFRTALGLTPAPGPAPKDCVPWSPPDPAYRDS